MNAKIGALGANDCISAKEKKRMYDAARRAENLELIRAQARASARKRRMKDPEAAREYYRLWYRRKMAEDPLWAFKKKQKNLSNTRRIQREAKARWRAKNPEASREALRQWQKKNPQRLSELCKRWRDKNPQTVKASLKRWATNNPDRIAYHSAKRKALKLGQMHPLANRKAIKRLHWDASKLTKETGIRWDVDHIIPLTCGGYEHELNMQLLPRSVNIAKHANPFWYHPDYKTWMDVPKWLWPAKMIPMYVIAEIAIKKAA